MAMNAAVLTAFAGGEPDRAASLLSVRLDPECELAPALARLRLSQLREEAALHEWLLRAIVRRPDGTLIGHIGFHSAPDPEYLRDLAPGAVEIGYTVYAPYRREGYALEAVTGLMRWATETHGVTDFVASVSPSNVASLGLLHKLSAEFSIRAVGRHTDPEDGPEDIYLIRAPAHEV